MYCTTYWYTKRTLVFFYRPYIFTRFPAPVSFFKHSTVHGMMVTDYIDGEAQLSQDEFDSGDEFIKDADSQDNLFIDNSDVVMDDDSSHMEVDMNQIAVESEQTMQQALAVQNRLETALQTRQAQPVNRHGLRSQHMYSEKIKGQRGRILQAHRPTDCLYA